MPVDTTKIPTKLKEWIDNATYEQMLERWRFSPIGDPMFIGETGEYFIEVFKRKSDQLTQEEKVRTSKDLGWER
jgi:hypothetical protein